MTVTAWTATSQQLPVGDVWDITVYATDADCLPVDAAPVVTVTLPGGGTATPLATEEPWGWRALYAVTTPGRYVARVVAAGYGAVDFTCWVTAVVTGADMPTIEDLGGVDGYLGEHSWTDEELQDALDAEAAAQRRCCTIPADYPADLRQALLRRAARNLSMRRLTLSVQRGDSEGGDTTILPGRDPEVRRFEKNYPKLGVG
jgi:hypothetical protein